MFFLDYLPLFPFQASLSEEVHQKLRDIEAEQSFQELAVLRRVAMARVKKERDLVQVSCVSVCLSVCPAVQLFVHLSVCLSVCLSAQ